LSIEVGASRRAADGSAQTPNALNDIGDDLAALRELRDRARDLTRVTASATASAVPQPA
jgi:hypothetical protein